MKLLRGSSRHRTSASIFSSLIAKDAIQSPHIYRTRLRVNLVNCDVGTNHNLVLGSPSSAFHKNSPINQKNSTITRLLWFFMGIISFSSVCVAIAFAIQRPQYIEHTSVSIATTPPSYLMFNATEQETKYPTVLPSGQHIYSKQMWKGVPAISETPLLHPTPVVVISHTATEGCDNFNKCSSIVKRIQSMHLRMKTRTGNAVMVDIGYNFLIGGDGNVYEGRGWDVAGFHRKSEGVIGISFIGNFEDQQLKNEQILSCQELLDLGITLKKLSPMYVLIAHSQTVPTKSPGKNVVRVIKTWPHWSANYRIT